MANANFKKKSIKDSKNSGFGKYQEGVGGGASPEARDPGQRAPGVNSDYRKQNNDTMQPRTGDGKFTYKSVNGQSIDPKYGPSRGKTVNPLLTGGENGVKIDDVEQEFYSQSGSYWDKYKDSWYQKGSEKVTLAAASHKKEAWKTKVSAEAIWNVAKRRFDSVKGEFEGESDVFSESKPGRSSKEESAAKQKAEATGEEQYVASQKTGGIKLKPGFVQQPPVPAAPKAPKAAPQPTPTPVIPTAGQQPQQPQQPAGQPAAQPGTNLAGSLKHTADQLSAARQLLADNGFDVTGYTDEQLDAIVDQFIDFDSPEDEAGEEQSAPAQSPSVAKNSVPSEEPDEEEEEEEETEAAKKIRKMGFTDDGGK